MHDNKLFILLCYLYIIFGVNMNISAMDFKELEHTTFGAGCFWCVEAVFERLKGVKEVQSGYMGGEMENPAYEDVCGGNTGHAEVIQLNYDPQVISFNELLEVFWIAHDPTTKNRQGSDIGTQYRSAIFYHTENQQKLAEKSKKLQNDANMHEMPIVTEILPLQTFYPAEKYHQNYYRLNSNAPYCKMVIQPKIDKLFNK
jgi:peptide-methionine (S)-S-oxide reductase